MVSYRNTIQVAINSQYHNQTVQVTRQVNWTNEGLQ